MKKSIKDIQASVKGRLLNKAKQTKRPFAELLQYYGMERFLYRVSKSKYANQFILKGALMFTVWNVPKRRTTVDIDFLAHYGNEVKKIEGVIKDVCKIKIEPDGLLFDSSTIEGRKIKEAADYEGVRIKFKGYLQKSRINMQIDVGFGDVIVPRPKIINYPVILDFPKPHLKGYTFESAIAEKVEAMVKLGLLNSRMKDFYDVWLLIRQFDFQGKIIAQAIKKTFTHRKTELPKGTSFFAPEIYDEKSDRQTMWKEFLKKGDIRNAPASLKSTALSIEKFLMEPIQALHSKKPLKAHWQAPGPWK